MVLTRVARSLASFSRPLYLSLDSRQWQIMHVHNRATALSIQFSHLVTHMHFFRFCVLSFFSLFYLRAPSAEPSQRAVTESCPPVDC
jgi:hypothetical protein